jgi:hypothetical protein
MLAGCLVVMQPTYLPWAGYFNLIAQADDFVFLDDVQLEKQSWQTRNRILLNGELCWVSIPVRHERLDQTIMDTDIVDNSVWRKKLVRGFAQNYGRHPFYQDAQGILNIILHESTKKLASFNEILIRYIAGELGIFTRFHRSSELGISGVRTARLAAICNHFRVKRYLSPVGSSDYLIADRFSDNTSAILSFQKYSPPAYRQIGSSQFISHLSVVDVIANIGLSATKDYILKDIEI